MRTGTRNSVEEVTPGLSLTGREELSLQGSRWCGAVQYTKGHNMNEGLRECGHLGSYGLMGVARAAGNETVRSHRPGMLH